VNTELKGLVRWIKANKLSLNVNKSQFIVFSKGRHNAQIAPVTIDNKTVRRATHIKFLGVLIDEKLTWSDHVSFIRGKISRSIGMLNVARPLLDKSILVKLYYSFLFPLFTYCLDVWGRCSSNLLHSLFKIQKRAIRLITFSRKLAHTAPLFRSLNILPLYDLYILSIAMFMFKFYSKQLPPSLDVLFRHNTSVHSIATRQRHNLHPPAMRSEIGKKSIRYTGVKIWNQILQNQRFDPNISYKCFKKQMMTALSDSFPFHL
jgi:hypothetical protein